MNNLNTIDKNGLDKIDSSPLDYWYAYLRENAETHVKSKETIFDIAFRCAVLEPDVFKETYVKIPKLNMKTNLGKSEMSRLLETASASKHHLINEEDFDIIMEMKSELKKHPLFNHLFSKGYADKKLDFEQEDSGVLINFKPHWICEEEPIIISLSSTKDATMDAVSKDLWQFKAHRKSALQVDGMKSVTGLDYGFLFVVVEKTAPHKINMFYPDERAVILGRETYKSNCLTFKECVESDKWPGLDQKISAVNLPNWAYKNQ